MLRFKNVFSDHALFQRNAQMEVRGWSEANARLTLTLLRGEEAVFTSRSSADDAGRFALPLTTPEGGYDRYSIRVTDGSDTAVISDVLFGELWLAGGQSNMEMPMSQMADRKAFAESVRALDIRFYQDNFTFGGGTLDMDFAFEDQEDAPGYWCRMDDERIMDGSALALSTCRSLIAQLDMPVGFLNCNMGGTHIEEWLPHDHLGDFSVMEEELRKANRWPDPEKFNTFGGVNFQQAGAMYYLLVPALTGVKVRGVWWYQGEGNAGYERAKDFYKAAMDVYHSLYKKLFAAGDDFPMICSLLYYWYYGEEAGRMGAVNLAMVEQAQEQPERFSAVPNYDLPPVWAVNLGNHPIHPAHKLALGERFAQMTMNRCYGGTGLCSAASLAETIIGEHSLRLRFDTHGFPLTAQGKLCNFSVAGEDGVYLPAEAKIISDDTVELMQANIPHPTRAMYQYIEPELGGNLCCGEFPVAPLVTYPEPVRPLPMRPWLDLSRNTIWVIGDLLERDGQWPMLNAYNRAVWNPGEGCELCRDEAFARSGAALRICGETSPVSLWTRSFPTMRLDLENFSALQLDVFGYEGVSALLELTVRRNEYDCRTIRIDGALIEKQSEDWARYEFPLNLEPCDIVKMRLSFDVDRPVKGVSIENIALIPR